MWWTTASLDVARVPQRIEENPLTGSSALFQVGLPCCLQKSPLVHNGACLSHQVNVWCYRKQTACLIYFFFLYFLFFSAKLHKQFRKRIRQSKIVT